MKVLIVSEGKHELQTEGKRGALLILVEKLIGNDCEFETRKVSDPAIILEKGKGDGMFKRCVAWIRFAERHGFDAVALVIDEDGDRDRLRQLNQAQDEERFIIPRALGLAIRSFDAWILADEKALAAVKGEIVQRQPNMEDIRDPKTTCDGICAEQFSLSDFYALVAERIAVEVLIDRCPLGFAPFAQRVRSLR